MMLSIGRRLLLHKLSPTRGEILSVCARVCSIDMNSLGSLPLNAQVSPTCWPCVLLTLTWLPFGTWAAVPLRAGITMTAFAITFPFSADPALVALGDQVDLDNAAACEMRDAD